MKKNYAVLMLAVLLTGIMSAQESQKNFINYQGVARNADNALMSSEDMTINIALKFGAADANAIYEESHSITTDANGVFSLMIGTGSPAKGEYNTLPWGSAATFVTVSLNGNKLGTTEMMSVPYAISSGKTVDQSANEVRYDNSVSGLSATTAQEAIDELITGGTVDADPDPTNELQTISFDSGTSELSLSDGNTIFIPTDGTDADADPTNEIQTISFDAASNKISLTDGGEITIPSGGTDADADPANELQTLSFDVGTNELSLSDGNSVTIPSGGTDADADPTNEIQTISFDVGTNELSLSDGGTVTIPSGGTDADADPTNEIDVTRRRGLLVGDDGIVDGLIGTADGQVAKWNAALGNWVAGNDEIGGAGGASLWSEEATHIYANNRVGINTGVEVPKTLFEIAGVPGVSADVGFTNALFTITDNELTGGPFRMVMGGKAIQTLANGVPSSMMLNLEGGEVGIGTFPTKTLDVDGDARIRNLSGLGQRNVMADANGNLVIGAGASGSSLWSESGGDINYTGGVVGIGTDTPGFPLDVKGNVETTLNLQTSDNNNFIRFVNSDGYQGYSGILNGNQDMDFGTGTGNVTGKVHLVIDSTPKLTVANDGNVGIGTLVPASKLDVDGDIRSSDLAGAGQRNVMADANGSLIIGASGGGSSLWTENDANISYNSGNVGIGTVSPSSPLEIVTGSDSPILLHSTRPDGNGWIRYNNETGRIGYTGMFNGTKDMELGTSGDNLSGKVHLTIGGTPKLTLVPNGNVGIGIDEPEEKFQVGGNLLVQSNLGQLQIGYPGTGNRWGLSTLNNGADLQFQSRASGAGTYSTHFRMLQNGEFQIGDIGGPTAWAHILNNSTLSKPQLKLEEEGNDYARLEFTNDAASGAFWHVAGLPSTSSESARLNFYFRNASGAGDRMTITGDGEVGINGTPTARLHIHQRSQSVGTGLRFSDNTTNQDWDITHGFGLRFHYGGNLRAVINANTGAYIQSSDERLKSKVKKLPNIMEKVAMLNPTTYHYKADKSQTKTMGFIAQEVEKLFPELVSRSNIDNVLGINYSGFGVVAIRAIQEQQTTIAEQIKKITDLEERLKRLEAKFSD